MRTFKYGLVSVASVLAISTCQAEKPRDGRLLTIHGQIATAEGSVKGAYVLLFAGEQLLDSAGVGGDGGFAADLPVNIQYVLEVHQAGFMAKRIVMDTRHAFAHRATARANR